MKLSLEVILDLKIEDVGMGYQLFKVMIPVVHCQYQHYTQNHISLITY